MGNTGPCGPCSEIFYDHAESSLQDDDRIVEIWNLVFMEFNKDKEGNLQKLQKKCIDTGMGLERIAAVMQNVHDNYDIDDLLPIEVSQDKIDSIKSSLPELPDQKKLRYIKELGISEYDADVIVSDKAIADYFEELTKKHDSRLAVTWLTVELFGRLNKYAVNSSR